MIGHNVLEMTFEEIAQAYLGYHDQHWFDDPPTYSDDQVNEKLAYETQRMENAYETGIAKLRNHFDDKQ